MADQPIGIIESKRQEAIMVEIDFKREVVKVRMEADYIPDYDRQVETRIREIVKEYFPNRISDQSHSVKSGDY